MKDKSILEDQRGFTLVELLIVITIIVLLVGITAPRLMHRGEKAKVGAARMDIEKFGQALDLYRLDTGRYPTSSEGLAALVTNPGAQDWDGPYLKKKKINNDPWKTPYVYTSPGANGDYDLVSYGKDKSPGGDAKLDRDINSWE